MTNRIKVTVFVLACLTTLTFCQNNTKNGNGIDGMWSYVLNDSIYEEIIFTTNTYWGYDEKAGEVKGKYILENDSLKTFYFGGSDYLLSKVIDINENEFLLENVYFKAHYYRLNIKIDTVRLIQRRRRNIE